ncbi:MAG: dephospho-CoA kinase [Candidatus Krumholzibacteriia bacterium]
MRRWALTGPSGAGKSAAGALLAARGAAILDGDALGHEVLARPGIAAAIGRAFGPEVLSGGAVDRSRLGPLVFADPAALARLDALVHPTLARLMQERLDALAAAGEHALAVLEAAVYFLLPTPPPVDLVVAVDAPAALRARRLAAARGLDEAAAAARIAAQASWDALWSRADRIIVNDGTPADLARAVDALWRDHGPARRAPSPQGDPQS